MPPSTPRVPTSRPHTSSSEKLSSALARAEAEAAILRSELQTAQSRAESAEQDLSVTVEAHAEVGGSLRRIESELKHAHQAKASVEAGLAGAHAEIERLLAEDRAAPRTGGAAVGRPCRPACRDEQRTGPGARRLPAAR